MQKPFLLNRKAKYWFRILSYFFMGTFFVILGCKGSKSELPNFGNLPAFQLLNQENQTVSLEDYQGKVWVANFIFTSCAGTCPMLTRRMKKIQGVVQKMGQGKELPPIRIVSFSVDPERDTPERLKKYGERFGVDSTLWTFLTGPLDRINQIVVHGFKISMGKVPLGAKLGKATEVEIFDVVHGEKFVLVDQQGQIRGYYNSDPPGLKKLIADLKFLLKKAS